MPTRRSREASSREPTDQVVIGHGQVDSGYGGVDTGLQESQPQPDPQKALDQRLAHPCDVVPTSATSNAAPIGTAFSTGRPSYTSTRTLLPIRNSFGTASSCTELPARDPPSLRAFRDVNFCMGWGRRFTCKSREAKLVLFGLRRSRRRRLDYVDTRVTLTPL